MKLPEPVALFKTLISHNYEMMVDAPSHFEGEWWLDLVKNQQTFQIVWKHKYGFGIFADEDETIIFQNPHHFVATAHEAYAWLKAATDEIMVPLATQKNQKAPVLTFA